MQPYDKKDPQSIQSMFGSIAKKYDTTNGVLSFQLHRYWNKKLVAAVIGREKAAAKAEKKNFADLCCGTGAIAFTWLRKEQQPKNAQLIDFCREMLECAKLKARELGIERKHAITYLQADVHSIPLETSSIDYATMAYGIRNVCSPIDCFKEVYRILNSGGTFGILELTEPKGTLLKVGHAFYLKCLLPLVGKCLTANREAYTYLSKTIGEFAKPAALKALLQEAGFAEIEVTPLTGGIATLIVAVKK